MEFPADILHIEEIIIIREHVQIALLYCFWLVIKFHCASLMKHSAALLFF